MKTTDNSRADALTGPYSTRYRSVGDWLWCELMDYCKERGTPPSGNDRLFEIVNRARAAWDCPVEQHEAAPAGWTFDVRESDGRIWLQVKQPDGAYCVLSAAASIDEGRQSTIAAQVLRNFANAQPAPSAPLEGTGNGADERATLLSDDEYCDLQAAVQALELIASGLTYAKDHDLDGTMQKATIRDAMRHAKNALRRLNPVYHKLADTWQEARASSPNWTGAEGAKPVYQARARGVEQAWADVNHNGFLAALAMRSMEARILYTAPTLPEQGLEALRDVIRCLRETSFYRDEEGEATNALETLLVASPAAPRTEVAGAEADKPYQVIIDRRDLFDALRGAWRDGQSYGDSCQQVSWSQATDYASRILPKLTNFAAPQPSADAAAAPADEPSELEQVITCLGDDAATLRHADQYTEMADNMEAAARLLESCSAILAEDRDADGMCNRWPWQREASQPAAAAGQEAVAWVRKHPDTGELSGDWLWNDAIEQCRKDSGVWFPLGYLTAPPAQVATRQLTDEQRKSIWWAVLTAEADEPTPGSLMHRRAQDLRALLATQQPEPRDEPIAWESTTPVYTKYITDERYQKFSPEARKWYKPYRCSACSEPRDEVTLSAEQVEWVVNDIAELGVKIGNQFFFLYKGYSLVYEDTKHDDGSPMHWRHVFKREFGECAHPINYQNPTLIGTVSLADSEDWAPLPSTGASHE